MSDAFTRFVEAVQSKQAGIGGYGQRFEYGHKMKWGTVFLTAIGGITDIKAGEAFVKAMEPRLDRLMQGEPAQYSIRSFDWERAVLVIRYAVRYPNGEPDDEGEALDMAYEASIAIDRAIMETARQLGYGRTYKKEHASQV